MASSRQQDGEEAAVQRASNLFLQQVEDSRRRYAFEVEEMKVRFMPARLTRSTAYARTEPCLKSAKTT